MKFKELTDEQIEKARNIYLNKTLSWDDRMNILVGLFGKSERTVRKWCSEKLNFKEKVEVEPEQYIKAKTRLHDKEKKVFFITFAQNNTPAHKGLLKRMEFYRDFHNADIHVIAGRYKNPTSVWTNNQENEEFWADEVLPYLDANRHDIHKYVSIMSDIKIQPTAVNPMTGMHALSGINSCVFGAPKVQMETIPVLDGNKAKIMLTTGAITKKNYTDSKSGKVGDFHHTFGFVIVEIKDDNTFFMRQVTADDKTGDFTDLFFKVDGSGVSEIDSISTIVLGDLHYGHHDQEVLDSTMKLMDKLTPEHVILHDVFDGNSISHHEMKDPFVQYGKEIAGTNDLGKEIEVMLDGLQAFEKFKNVVIVRSNHDDFLDRWLKNEDWKKQPTYKNSRLYMRYSDILLEQYGTDPNNVKGVIPYLINEKFPNFITLGRSSSYSVKGWELGQHGDMGSNGSRGSLLQFRKLNTKIIVGHYHSPGRKDGALAVGTSTHLRVGYNKGASGWLQSHVIIHNDGRSQHINFINGEYTTF
tara:strand:+ start:7389 stop:8969 length:1581 start_codon:yes stop_codon:yes gene_type:complete